MKNYELIFRASRDGFNSSDFHQKCDNRVNTVSIILTKNGRRFGGFTDLKWDQSNQYKVGGNSFIFSLDNHEIYYKDELYNYEIGCYSFYGTNFARFYLLNNCNNKYNEERKYYYNCPKNVEYILSLNKEFLVEDYEVYQIYFEQL